LPDSCAECGKGEDFGGVVLKFCKKLF